MMKRKIIRLLGFCTVLILLLTACGSSTTGKNTASAGDSPAETTDDSVEKTSLSEDGQPASPDQPDAAGYDILGGQLWEVSGVLVRNKVFDIHDNKDLESMYRATYLNFGSDGRFLYLDVVPKGGTYEPYGTENGHDTYLLKTDQIYQYDTDKGTLVESTSGTKKPYIIYVLDDNTLEFVEFDSMTGKAKANEIPLFFSRSNAESPYVQDHKTGIANSNGDSAGSSDFNSDSTYSSGGSNFNSDSTYISGSTGDSNYSADSSADSLFSDDGSYESILDTYTEKMKSAVPGLVSEYKSEASGVSDIETLAEISNNKISKLAEICNEGVGKMAQLMNTRGDSYDTYESWAGKLMDKYTDIAQEIQDAYLDSDMY